MNNHLTAQAIYQWIDSVAPFDSQEEFDNSGFQVGEPEQKVTAVLLALDVTEEVIREAVDLKAEAIVSHHPLIFSPLKNLVLTAHVPKLVAGLLKHRISLISAHTNLDQSPLYSGSAAAAKLMKLKNIRQASPYLFLGDLENEMTDRELNTLIATHLSVPARQYGRTDKPIKTVGIVGGSYSEGYLEAKKAGAQAFLTGEVRHHHAVEANEAGILLYDGGHFATEAPMLKPLALGLQKMADGLKYNLQVHVSRSVPYRLQ